MESNGKLLRKCDDLLDLLRDNEDHAKLLRLIQDIEDLRDRIIAARDAPAKAG